MNKESYEKFKDSFKFRNLFLLCLLFSLFVHVSSYASYYISTLVEPAEIDSSQLNPDVDVNIEEIPPELIGGTSSPAPVEKNEWVEGTNKDGKDPDDSDIDPNKVSGNGTDKDGYLFSFNGDKPPTPIIDFDLKQFFPPSAKAAGINDMTVTLLVQIDETGKLQGAKVVSGRAGHGFDEAAIKVVNLARWSPGYVAGKPTRMAHRVPVVFTLDE